MSNETPIGHIEPSVLQQFKCAEVIKFAIEPVYVVLPS